MITFTYKNKTFALISDTHGWHKKISVPKCDFLVHCGDFCVNGNENQIIDFLDWFSKAPAKYKILITGNHDFPFVFEPDVAKKRVPKNIILANNTIICLEGIRFYGLVSDYNFTKIPELSNKPIDFLLSHVPPKSVLDEGIGCPILLEFVKLQKPKHHLFGHIHSFGLQMKTLHKTVFINCCTFPEI